METKELLEKLNSFESLLANFAYAELKSKDAVDLRQKFHVFKSDLKRKIFNESIEVTNSMDVQNRGRALLFSQKVFRNAQNTAELLQFLKKTEFSQKQDDIIQNIEINTLILMELSMNILNK